MEEQLNTIAAIRRHARVDQTTVAEHMGSNRTKGSKIENAKLVPDPARDDQYLDAVLAVMDERRAQVAAAIEEYRKGRSQQLAQT